MKNFLKEIGLWIGIWIPIALMYELKLFGWHWAILASIISITIFQKAVKDVSDKKYYVVRFARTDGKKRKTVLIGARSPARAFQFGIEEAKKEKGKWGVDQIRRIK